MKEIRLNDIGVKIKMTIKDLDDAVVDISSATTKQFFLKKPDGTVLTKTAGFFTDGTDGIIYYNTIVGDIDTIGIWEVQAYLVISSGSYKSTIVKFRVTKILA